MIGQELPPIINYSKDHYGAANQNWMISQAKDKFIYVANNDGLLEFNGSKWTLYPTPNQSIMRSVKVIGDSIFTGFYMDFGYWKKNETGELKYTPLSKKLGIEIIEDEQFWNICSINKWLIFQSLDRIIMLNSDTMNTSIIKSNNIITKVLPINEELFFQIIGEGLFTLKDGEKVKINEVDVAKNVRFIGVCRLENKVAFITETEGIFLLDENNNLARWNQSVNLDLYELNIYNAIQKRNGDIILGTISNGIVSISPEGKLQYNLEHSNGLSNNTALTLFEDIDENVWVGLDNGIDCINSSAAVKNYIDHKGNLGNTYASAVVNNTIYLGTNQGLFYKPIDSTTQAFKIIPSTEGPVWNLNLIDNTLFCGHNLGTFIIKDEKAILISDIPGTWGIKKFPHHDNLLLQGNYDGLYILEKNEDSWSLRNKINGFNISSRHFEITHDYNIFVSHEYKGVFSLQLDSTFNKITKNNKLTSIKKSIHSSLATLLDDIYYASKEGVYRTDINSEFKRIPELSYIFEEDEYTSGKIINDGYDRLWFFTNSNLVQVSRDNIDNSYKIVKISIPSSVRNEMRGYENLTFIDKERFIYGNSSGYLLIDLTQLKRKSYSVSINSIVTSKDNLIPERQTLNNNGQFNFGSNNITFAYSIPEFDKYLTTSFQYKLTNIQEHWSNWSSLDNVSFKNISPGDYTFEVRAKINDFIIDETATYSFTILKPWYLTTTAWVIYSFLFISLILIINNQYKRYYRKQRERILEKSMNDLKVKELASQKEIIELKNIQLQKDIESRNRELAISTMNLVGKTTTLNSIKQQLKKLNENNQLNPVINNIDKIINDKKDWEFFEKAFNEADKEFFKRLKEKHPKLTLNDLRLCVYLRLNLSSKEIAPLLNISHRSVEIKRYRLRKKIDLEHNINLNDYFINL